MQVYKLEKKAQNTVVQRLVPQASVESVLQQGAFQMLVGSTSVPHALSAVSIMVFDLLPLVATAEDKLGFYSSRGYTGLLDWHMI